MDFLGSFQGIVVVGLVALIIIGGFIVRRQVRKYQNRLIAKAGGRAKLGDGRARTADRAMSSISTTVDFSVGVDQATSIVSTVTLPNLWKQTGQREWTLQAATAGADPTAIAVLENTTEGARLAVARSADLDGLPAGASDWRKLRQVVIEAAAAANYPAVETTIAPFVRTQINASEAATQASHAWLRP